MVEDDFINQQKITIILKNYGICRTLTIPELDEFHTRFLKKVFEFLVEWNKKLFQPWVDDKLKNIKKTMKII